METQVNVIVGDGEPVAGQKSTWSNGSDTWHNIRIPKNATRTRPGTTTNCGYPFEMHAEGIGMTGWDWAGSPLAAWVGFDFDVLPHAKGMGVSDEELERVKQAAWPCPTSKPG